MDARAAAEQQLREYQDALNEAQFAAQADLDVSGNKGLIANLSQIREQQFDKINKLKPSSDQDEKMNAFADALKESIALLNGLKGFKAALEEMREEDLGGEEKGEEKAAEAETEAVKEVNKVKAAIKENRIQIYEAYQTAAFYHLQEKSIKPSKPKVKFFSEESRSSRRLRSDVALLSEALENTNAILNQKSNDPEACIAPCKMLLLNTKEMKNRDNPLFLGAVGIACLFIVLGFMAITGGLTSPLVTPALLTTLQALLGVSAVSFGGAIVQMGSNSPKTMKKTDLLYNLKPALAQAEEGIGKFEANKRKSGRGGPQ